MEFISFVVVQLSSFSCAVNSKVLASFWDLLGEKFEDNSTLYELVVWFITNSNIEETLHVLRIEIRKRVELSSIYLFSVYTFFEEFSKGLLVFLFIFCLALLYKGVL